MIMKRLGILWALILLICICIPNAACETGDIPPWGIARLDLENSIEKGDVQGAKDAYEKLVTYRADSVSTIGELGEMHMEFYAPKKYMDSLNKNLKSGKLDNAQSDLYYLASSCGQAICHKGSSGMGDLEYAYFDIKHALEDGDMDSAKGNFSKFKKGYYETKEDFRRIIPAKAEEMDDTYVDNLGVALDSGDMDASESARTDIATNLCAFNKGCHGGLFLGNAPTVKEALSEHYSDYSKGQEEVKAIDVESSSINIPGIEETEDENGLCGPTLLPLFSLVFLVFYYKLYGGRKER